VQRSYTGQPFNPVLQLQIQNQIFSSTGAAGITEFLAAPSSPDIADASLPGAVVFTWHNNAVGASANEIWRSDNGAPFSLLATIAPGATTYTDTTYAGQTYTEYKVRAIDLFTQSGFSAARGVATTLSSLSLASYSYPNLVQHFSDFNSNSGGTTSINFPLLRRVIGGSFLTSTPISSLSLPALAFVDTNLTINSSSLTSLTLSALTTVQSGNIGFSSNASLTSLSLPKLNSCPGNFSITTNAALTSVNFPLLSGVSGNMRINGSSSLSTIVFSVLTTVSGYLNMAGLSGLSTPSFPLLEVIGNDAILSGWTGCSSISFPSLTAVSGLLNISGATATSIDFSALQTCGSGLNASSLPNITSLSFAALTSSGGDCNFSSCTSLTSFSLPSITFGNNTINGEGDALDLTSVNALLATGVTSAPTTASFLLDGGTNAAPTGQGLTDTSTLVSAGNTVITNEAPVISVTTSSISWTIHRTPPASAQVEQSVISAGSWSVLSTVAWSASPLLVPSVYDYRIKGVTVDSPYSNTSTVTEHSTASSWAGRVVTNGGSAVSTATQRAVSDFCYTLDRKSLTSLIISINVFAPDSLVACLTPLIKGPGLDPWANVSSNFVAGDLNVNGLLGNGSSKWLGTGVTPNSAFSGDNSATLFVYESTTTVSNVTAMGAANSSSTRALELFTNSFTGQIIFDCWDNDSSHGRLVYSPITVAGFTLASRTASNVSKIYFANSSNAWALKGTSTNSSTGVHGNVTKDLGVFTQNADTGQFFFSNRRMSCAGVGLGMTSQNGSDLYDAIQAVRTAFGGGFV